MREQHTEGVDSERGSNTGRECDSESEGATRGGSVMVRVWGSNTGRECDSQNEGATRGGSATVGEREQHREGVGQ